MLKSAYNATAVGVGIAPRHTDVIPEPRNVRNALEEAERAASAGDLAEAENLLRDAARLQEAELGPRHPDLANTLNNLAIVAERRGRPRDAETFYRRAVEIASASLPPDDPLVAASRQNLEDFCRAQGLPIETRDVIEPAGAGATPLPTPKTAPPWTVSWNAAPVAPVIAIGVAALALVAFLIAQPRPSRREATTRPAAEPAPAPANASARPAHGALAPTDRTSSPAPIVDPAPASTAIALATAQLCQSFSPRDWHCAPASDSVEPGAIVLYTRVRSTRSAVVIHRWYQGGALRRSTQLRIAANAAEGYRTYSRQVVDPGDWRVEVRTADGDLLHEQRFTVR